MAEEKDIIFRVSADTSNARANVDKVTESLKRSNKDVQETFTNLRSRIKESEKSFDDIAKKYGENSRQAEEVRKRLGALNVEYNKLSSSNTDLGATLKDANGEAMRTGKSIQELTARMQALFLEGKQNTQEYRDLRDSVSEYRSAIISVNTELQQVTKSGQALGTALQVGSTVVAGYGVVQGSLVAMGVESDALKESFAKLQAVQTVLISLEQIKISLDKQSLMMTKAKAVSTGIMTVAQTAYTWATNATTVATKALRLAMLSLPIMLILAAIIALIAWIVKLASANDEVADSSENYTKALDRQNRMLERNQSIALKNYDRKIEMAKSLGASEAEIHKLTMERLKVEEDGRLKNMSNASKAMDDAQKMYDYYVSNGHNENAKNYKKIIQDSRTRYQELKMLDGDYEHKKEVATNDFNRGEADRTKSANDKASQAHEKFLSEKLSREAKSEQLLLDRKRLIEDYFIVTLEDDNVKKLATLEINHEREREDLINKFGRDTELMKSLTLKQDSEMQDLINIIEEDGRKKLRDKNKVDAEISKKAYEKDVLDRRSMIEGKLINIQNEFEAEFDLKSQLAKMEMDFELENTELTEGEKFKIKEEYNEKIRKLTEERKLKELAQQQATVDGATKIAQIGLDSIKGLTDIFYSFKKNKGEKGSEEELKQAKKAFEINKKMQLAQAVMTGVQSVMSAYSSGVITPFIGPATGAAYAVAAGITAMANIAKISSSKFEGGGNLSVEAPSIPTVGEYVKETNNDTLTDNLPNSGNSVNAVPSSPPIVIVQTDLEKAGAEYNNTANISSWG